MGFVNFMRLNPYRHLLSTQATANRVHRQSFHFDTRGHRTGVRTDGTSTPLEGPLNPLHRQSFHFDTEDTPDLFTQGAPPIRKMLAALRARAAKVIAEVVQAERTQLSALPTRVPLIHFAEKDLGRWQLQSDTSIGGFSKCSLVPASASTAVFSGSIELEADVQRQRQQRSDQGKLASKTGFCAMRTAVSEVDGWPSLYDFHGLSLRLRPDARGYVLNVRADSILGDDRTDDLYQTSIRPFLRGARTPEPHQPELLEVRIPWGAFALTWRGCVQSARPPPMNLNRLTHVGLLLADGESGAFSCELESISAFRFDEDEQVHDPFAREALRLNVDRGYDDVRDG